VYKEFRKEAQQSEDEANQMLFAEIAVAIAAAAASMLRAVRS
jgi:hypothetical protein